MIEIDEELLFFSSHLFVEPGTGQVSVVTDAKKGTQFRGKC